MNLNMNIFCPHTVQQAQMRAILRLADPATPLAYFPKIDASGVAAARAFRDAYDAYRSSGATLAHREALASRFGNAIARLGDGLEVWLCDHNEATWKGV